VKAKGKDNTLRSHTPLSLHNGQKERREEPRTDDLKVDSPDLFTIREKTKRRPKKVCLQRGEEEKGKQCGRVYGRF